jgi:glycosyltransferase involved in cell wall biosynthesis
VEEKLLNENKIAIVIPYYNASKQIISVISKIPSYITCVIIVDDKSKEALPKEELQKKINPKTKLVFLENERNLGVGGATKKGFKYAISQDLDILVKIDADDQMDLSFLPEMVVPISQNKTMVSKGNRFRNTKALQKMPVPRKLGNLILSFLVKIATGYWHNFDPTNGFIAIKSDVIRKIDFTKLSNRYYFETSLLSQLYFQKTSILYSNASNLWR